MKHSHPLTQGQAQAARELLGERARIDGQLRMVLNIAIADGALPHSPDGWALNAQTMSMEAEIPETPKPEAVPGPIEQDNG